MAIDCHDGCTVLEASGYCAEIEGCLLCRMSVSLPVSGHEAPVRVAAVHAKTGGIARLKARSGQMSGAAPFRVGVPEASHAAAETRQ